ncbi:hypothetical protein FKB34_15110 [Glycocaulis profundi]|nr:hypothetical protein FKB34_15110 [Glycocaulis profundi]
MFEKSTVVIVGAGASAEFGLPTSQKIFSDLLSERASFSANTKMNGSDLFSQRFINYLVYSTGKSSQSEIVDFIEKARGSFENSIDMFTYQNESLERLAKIYCAWKIYSGLMVIHTENDSFRGQHFSPRYTYKWRLPVVGGSPNWIASLTKKYVEKARDCQEVKQNLKIITFNYDTIIEDAMYNFLSKSERFFDGCVDIMPTIDHVYGSFVKISNEFESHTILKDSDSIEFVRGNNEYSPEVRSAVLDAEDIILIGFSLDPLNVEKIGLNQAGGKIYGLNYDGNLDVSARMRQLGVSSDCLIEGSLTTPMTVGQAAGHGLFSMPEYSR